MDAVAVERVDAERAARGVRWIASFAIGTLLAFGLALTVGLRAGPIPSRAGPIAVWAADRDASRVIGLDPSLAVARQVVVDWPIDVESCADGGLWVLRSSDGTPGGIKRLDRITPQGELESEITTGLALDLAVLEGRDALLIELEDDTPASARALRFGQEGSLRFLVARPGLLSIVASRASIVLGTGDGTLWRIDPHGAHLDRVDIGGRIADLAAGPEPGSVWALDTAGETRLVLLDAELDVVWSTAVGIAARHLAPVPGEERVWLADTRAPDARRFGPGGALEIDRSALPLAGLDRAIAWDGAGALLVAPGAILHLDPAGNLAPGQGGFAYLTDLAGAH